MKAGGKELLMVLNFSFEPGYEWETYGGLYDLLNITRIIWS